MYVYILTIGGTQQFTCSICVERCTLESCDLDVYIHFAFWYTVVQFVEYEYQLYLLLQSSSCAIKRVVMRRIERIRMEFVIYRYTAL